MSQPARPFDGYANQPLLLATRMLVPRLREGLVPRPRLLGRLAGALRHALTLVSAPAGFGKSTLLAEWLTSRPQGACWLSLDAADNDPSRFLFYAIAALQIGRSPRHLSPICPERRRPLVFPFPIASAGHPRH